MSYKPDQGRIARMVAFWVLFVLLLYGYFGFKIFLDNLQLGAVSEFLTRSYGRLPVMKEVTPNALLAYIVMPIATALILIRTFNRPRIADFLIETEGELRKVHWPNLPETRTASLVVITTVLVLGAYLFGADRLLGLVISGLLSLRGS